MSGRLTPNAQLVHNAKGVFHDLVDTAHSGLRLGNRHLDIEQYNGLRKPPTAQEEINGFPDQGEDVTESSTLEVTEQETRPSISEIFDIVTPREQTNVLHSESEPRSPSPAKRPDSPESIIALSPIPSAKKSDSAESIVDQINQLHISPTEPTMSTSTIAFTGTTPGLNRPRTWSFGRTNPPPRPGSTPPAGGGGGGGGRGGGRGGGGGGGGGGAGAGAPPQPANQGNIGKQGALPEKFEGDRSKAEEFIEDLRSYLRLNARVQPLNTYQGKVAFALTLISGPLVRDFVRIQGDTLDARNEHPDTWFDFLDAFNHRFLDTHRDTKARMEIENLKMKDNNVDKYDQRFRALAREAHYDLREISVLMKFLKGLPRSITQECICAPRPNDYTGLVQKAQETVALYADMNQLYGKWESGNQNQNWRSNQRQQNRNWPGRNQNRPGNGQGFVQANSSPQQYNSSNAPRRFNNTPVPMDMTARTRMNRQGNYRNYPSTQANVANAERPFKGKCFNCDMEGHISRNCKAPRRARIHTANAEEWATLEEELSEPSRGSSDDHIESSICAFSELSLKEKGEFVARMNQGESPQDFQEA